LLQAAQAKVSAPLNETAYTKATSIYPYLIMESPAFFYTIFLWCLLLSITGYSIYVGFGPPSKQLRDPFEEHED
jgi:PsbN protein